MKATSSRSQAWPDPAAREVGPEPAPPRCRGVGDVPVASGPMDWTELEYDVTDHIATIALNRPEKLNAGTPTMVGELLAAIDEVDRDDDVRAVILTGRGRAFCAGAAARQRTRLNSSH